MAATPFDDPLLSALLGDDGIAASFTSEVEVAEMNRFEAALAEAEAAEGVIPTDAAQAIASACAVFRPDFAALRAGAARDGVIGPEYVRQLRAHVGSRHGDHVHLGATSQDLADTSLVLRLGKVVTEFDARLSAVTNRLDDLHGAFGRNTLMGRTRMQDAQPIEVADRIRTWRGPLERHRTRLAEIRPRLLVLQFGGAVGTREKLGAKGDAVAHRLAQALGLGYVEPWHSQRDRFAELAAWLALVSGSLGKIGADVALMAQNAVAEVQLTGGGGSSAMPHKSNPVAAEVLVALARHNATLSANMQHALVHENERSGAAWTLEWLTLPQLVIGTAAALRTALVLLGRIESIGKPV